MNPKERVVLGFLVLTLSLGVAIQGYRRHLARSELSRLEEELILHSPTLIDLNRASIEELVELPGVGPVLAQRIVEYRELHGGFSRVEDLLKVRGIGEYKLKKIREFVTVGPSQVEPP